MSKVFIINNMTHDYTSAEKYGELVNVTEGKMPIFKTDTMRKILQDKLVDFTSEDYLLISGPTLMCIMAYQVALDILESRRVLLGEGDCEWLHLKTLVFDAKEQGYIVRHLSA